MAKAFESVIFESAEGRATVAEWHERFREAIPHPLRERTVTTQAGRTHALVGGPADAPPLVLLHGAMASSAHVLHELVGLLGRFRVYAVDVIGQSVMSADARLPVDDESYGRWLAEVMDGLGLGAAHVVGVSWGGFVAQRLAAVAPERILAMALLVPAGLVSGPAWAGFWKLGLPMAWYRRFPSEARRDALLRHLLTTPDDPLWAPFLGDAFLAYRLDMRVPALTREGELEALRAPVLAVGAERDLSFPGAKLLRRAREVIPSLSETALLEGQLHCPATTPEQRRELAERIGRFLDGPGPRMEPAVARA